MGFFDVHIIHALIRDSCSRRHVSRSRCTLQYMSFHTQTVSFQVERQFPAVLFHRATAGTHIEAGTISNQFSQRQDVVTYCDGEVIVIGPHLLGASAQGIYYLTSGKLKGKWKCWKIKMKKRRKMKLMKRSRKSERTLNSCMRHGDDHGME